MIEMLEAFLLLFGGFIFASLVAWIIVRLKYEDVTNDSWEQTEAGKEEIKGLVNRMKENGIVELEVKDNGFRIKLK